tara:strand:- start:162 stop:533 length:372 start_codon:yes stop_codon:yes gene_type:complete
MAAQVLSGENNLSYTNATGQNVRLVINYLKIKDGVTGTPTLSFPGVSINLVSSAAAFGGQSYGKSLAFGPSSGEMAANRYDPTGEIEPVPVEIALANGETFSINSSTPTDIEGYNIIIVPEAG